MVSGIDSKIINTDICTLTGYQKADILVVKYTEYYSTYYWIHCSPLIDIIYYGDSYTMYGKGIKRNKHTILKIVELFEKENESKIIEFRPNPYDQYKH